MNPPTTDPSDPLRDILAYHEATKHRLDRYAAGPGYLDWETQPDPFRRYAGARLLPLEKILPTDEPPYDAAFAPGRIDPVRLAHRSLSQLFFDSLALSAWKSAGGARWALRVNPSSGNLHPTEGYLLCGPVDGLCDRPMVCHYAPKAHALEVRAELDVDLWRDLTTACAPHTFFVGLTSILWREAWKYGQRAYRYCQHDAGHAIGAIGIAAAGLGWRTMLVDDLSTDQLARLLGTNRKGDAEPEHPDVLIAVCPDGTAPRSRTLPDEHVQRFASLDWHGMANHLSPDHLDWGVEEAADATRKPVGVPSTDGSYGQPSPPDPVTRPVALRQVIRQRRSAVAMDGQTSISLDTFYGMLRRTLPAANRAPFDALPWTPRVRLALFVHRVDDLPGGLYLLVRDPDQGAALRTAITRSDDWHRPTGCPDDLDLHCIVEADTRQTARQISCGQDIASDGCFSLGMIAEFAGPLERHGAWVYPRLFWETGVIGQVLYLEAEAAGIRSTGIGCYFDDSMHKVLGLDDRTYQDLYHFAVGGPVEDTRLTTMEAY